MTTAATKKKATRKSTASKSTRKRATTKKAPQQDLAQDVQRPLWVAVGAVALAQDEDRGRRGD